MKDENKRVAIRNAVVSEVLQSGLANACVAPIAKRAGVSAGTIYLHHPNKEVLLQTVFWKSNQNSTVR
ncbi:MAG: TetR/AcrR family transcriptional regulator [Hyphomicrobiales bacterium]